MSFIMTLVTDIIIIIIVLQLEYNFPPERLYPALVWYHCLYNRVYKSIGGTVYYIVNHHESQLNLHFWATV